MHLRRFQSHLAASRVVGLRLNEGDKEKGALRPPLLPLLPAPGGKPNTFPSHPPLKPTKQFTNPYLFICLSVVIAHVINCTRAFLAL